MQVGKRHAKAWIDREHICPYCGMAHSNAGDLREHVRCSCPCVEDDYIPARYTRFARQRDYNMDPRYEALSDVSRVPPINSCSLRFDISLGEQRGPRGSSFMKIFMCCPASPRGVVHPRIP